MCDELYIRPAWFCWDMFSALLLARIVGMNGTVVVESLSSHLG